MAPHRFFRPLALCAALSAPFAVAAQNVEFTGSSWLPPTHAVMADFFLPWAEELKEATDGRVTVKFLPKPVTNPQGHYDAVRDGLVDLGFVSHSYYPGRFELTKFAVMPFSGESAESRSVAAWNVYDEYLAEAGEHDGVHLLSIYAHGPGMVFTTSRPVESIDDFQGLKVRVGGGMAADVAQALGASALAKPAPESYELLSTGVADGVFFPAESLVSFKLDTLVEHATMFPGGLYSDTHGVLMNQDAYERLSPEDRATLDRLAGEYMARMAGQAWDKHDAEGRKALDASGATIVMADEEFVEAVKERTAPFEQAWLDAAEAKGIDGPAALAEFRRQLDELDADQS